MKKFISTYQNICIIVLTGVLLVFAFFHFHHLSPFIYLTNDDLFFKTIISGEMTGAPNPRLWYIGYPIGLLVSSLYRLLPQFPWYGLFLCFTIFLSVWTVICKCTLELKHFSTRLLGIAIFLFGFYGFVFLHIAELQFTTVTGLIGSCAVFLFYFSETKDTFPDTFRSYLGFFLLSAYAMCIRDKGFLMLLPFIGMIGLAKFWDEKKKRKNLCFVGCVFLILLLLVKLVEGLAYSSLDWKQFGAYTGASETIYDYTGYPDYDTHRQTYEQLGLTYSSYDAAAHHYNIQLEPLINRHTMETLEQIALEDQARTMTLTGKCSEMARFFIDRHLSYTDRPLNLLVYSCYILFILSSILIGKYKALRDILFLVIARMATWLYLIYYGRLPARVSQAVYFAELFLLLAIAFKHALWIPSAKRKWHMNYALCIWAVIVLCFVGITLRFGVPKAKAAAWEANARCNFSNSFTEIKDYFAQHPDCLYYLDMNSFGSFTEDGLKMGVNSYGNYLFMGSWVPHSPWYDEKFRIAGIKEDEAALALIENPNVYAVFMKTDTTGYAYLSDFYAENYPGTTLEVVEEISVSNDITFQIVHGVKP